MGDGAGGAGVESPLAGAAACAGGAGVRGKVWVEGLLLEEGVGKGGRGVWDGEEGVGEGGGGGGAGGGGVRGRAVCESDVGLEEGERVADF